jgi:hypothetical protein
MDLFSTNILTGVVNSLLNVPPQFLVDTFFPGLQTETSEEIHFDVEADVMGLAPFVSPFREGQIMTNLGYTTKTFKPAYVKPKNVWNPNAALKRMPGEALTGSLNPADRMRALVAQTLMTQRAMISRRLEWMAGQILATGGVTISGDAYETVVISFGRDGSLTVPLTGASRWGQAGVSPLEDLQTWADLVQAASGSAAKNVVMSLGAWKLFKKDAGVTGRLYNRLPVAGAPTLLQDASFGVGGEYKGSIDGFDIWTYSGFYRDTAGAVQPILPVNTLILTGQLQGVKAFGAIQDHESLEAVPYFSKSWLEQDPSRRMVMTQSAPLLVPYRPNASLCATVTAAA